MARKQTPAGGSFPGSIRPPKRVVLKSEIHLRGISTAGNGEPVTNAAAARAATQPQGIPGAETSVPAESPAPLAAPSAAPDSTEGAGGDSLEMIAASTYSDAIPMGEEESSLAIDLADPTEPEIRETGSEHAYFRMDFYLMDDQLRCRFYTTPDKKDDGLLFYGFEVVDNVSMREYIRNHLPENLRKKLEQKSRLPEPVAVAVPKTALPLTRAEPVPVSAKSGTVLPAPALIERIVITQARQKIEIKLPHRVASKEPARLVRGLPWSLGMTVELDRAPAANELSALRKSYSITTCLIQLQRMRRFPSTTVELNLAPGKKQYESEITSRGLEPGRYALDIKTVVPFLLKDERKTLELVVQ